MIKPDCDEQPGFFFESQVSRVRKTAYRAREGDSK